MFEFTPDCLTGIDIIDNEHRNLFNMLNRASALLSDDYQDDYYHELKDLVTQLESYADEHFKHEEAEMVRLRDPELMSQRAQHNYFRDKVHEYEFENMDSSEEQKNLLTDMVNFLARWLYRHILSSDILIGKLPPLEEWMMKDNPCEFSEEYLTGIEIVDVEHKELFRIIDEVNQLAKDFNDVTGFDKIMSLLGELTEYTKQHFKDEEEYMTAIGYDGLEAQKRAHDSFVDKLENIDIQAVDDNPKKEINSLLEFLLGWLINHILHTDKKIPVVKEINE
jgi:hemerythrin